MVKDRLYRLSRRNYQGNTGNQGGLIFKGAAVNVLVYGSQTKPANLAAMVDITEEGSIVLPGAYSFSIFPEYIAITGTVTGIEIVNYDVEDLGAIS
jgi:hypothetical protein